MSSKDMPSGWQVQPLSELADMTSGKGIPRSEYVDDGPYPIMGSNGLLGRCTRPLFEHPVITIGRVGACGEIHKTNGPSWVSDNALVTIPKEGCDFLFLYYLLKQIDFTSIIGGTTQPLITQTAVKTLMFPIPPLPEQRAIAHILGTLDDKIELNRRMNETLEAMARALFKSWFVDFDPVRAKAAGRDTGLPKDIADLFPDRFVDSELGEIPEGWKVKPIGELIEFVKGKKPPAAKEFQEDGSLPIILIDSFQNGSSTYAKPDGMIQCDFEDILMVMDGSSSGRVETGCKGIVGSTIARLEPKQACLGKRFLFYFLKYLEPETRMHLTGTSIPHVDKSWIKEQCVPFPNTREILDLFEYAAGVIRNRILTGQRESHTLAALRDILLPRLLSGELRVGEAEALLDKTI